MPAPRQQQPQGNGTAVATSGARQTPQEAMNSALVAVTHEIDNRYAIVRASAAAGISPDRLKLVALTVFTRTPDLLACEPVSIARALVEAAQLGLEPTGLLGGAYLVPRGGKATLLVGYKGLVILAKRSGEVAKVEARVVRAKDGFDYEYGLDSYLRHRPSTEPDPGAYTAAYACIYYRDGSRQFDVMNLAEIEAIRKRSSTGNAGPWVTDWPEMAKKTVLRRLLKLAPLSIEVAQKLDELDPEAGDGASTSAPGAEAELRQQLQAALEREYGQQPALGAGTTQGAGAGTPAAQAGDGAKGASAAPQAPEQAQQPAAASGGAAAPAASKPERVGAILGSTCGIVHAGLGLGPCTLPAGHTEAAWQDTSGTDHPPQREHDDGNGNRWTMPQASKGGNA